MYVSRPKQYTEPSIYCGTPTPSTICLSGLPGLQDPARPVPLQETAPKVDGSGMVVGVVNCLLVLLLGKLVNQIILHYKLLVRHSPGSSQSISTSPRSSPSHGRHDKNSNPSTVIVGFDARADVDETSQTLCGGGVGNLSEGSGRTSGGLAADVGSSGILMSTRKVLWWRVSSNSRLIESGEPPSEIYMLEGADFGNVVKSSPDDVCLACAGGICSSDNGGIDSGAIWGVEAAWSDPVGRAGGGGVMSCAKGVSGDAEVLAMSGGIIISTVMNEGR